MAKAGKLDTETIRAAAAGRWLEILERVAGIPRDLLDPSSTQEHPCPKCGGETRFRLMNADAGAVRWRSRRDGRRTPGVGRAPSSRSRWARSSCFRSVGCSNR